MVAQGSINDLYVCIEHHSMYAYVFFNDFCVYVAHHSMYACMSGGRILFSMACVYPLHDRQQHAYVCDGSRILLMIACMQNCGDQKLQLKVGVQGCNKLCSAVSTTQLVSS